jgi:undecaprenyl-phosphate galactose phosphotransferase/putative colanic acid biosynthesis UDP-glucose lipid carrier transferase
MVPDADTEELLRYKCAPVGRRVAIEVRREPLNRIQRALKRLLDICLSSVFIAVLLPAFIIIAAAIKLDSRGPVIFFQTRYGLRGRPFRIVKFRTMSVLEDGAVVLQARRNDARVTRVGRILRRTSADELPQLFNVLAGQMSFVGPRPHARAHDEFYAATIEHYEIRQYVKPGITGWAQVNGHRGETPTLEHMYRRIEHDLWYAGNASLLLDFEILIRTVFVVLNFQGAF